MFENLILWMCRPSLKARVTLFTLAIFIFGIWSLSFYASRMLREDMQRLLGEQQFSAVTNLATEVAHELDDRLTALEIVADSVGPAQQRKPQTLQTLLDQRPLLQRLFNGGISAVLFDGTAIAPWPFAAGRISLNDLDKNGLLAALKSGKPMIGRPAMVNPLVTPVLIMAVPIRNAQGRVIGALVGPTDLGKPNFLDQITKSRYGKSGGYLLVDPQQRLIVTASNTSQIMQPLPAPGIVPAIDRFIQGYEGSAVYVNQIGVEVMTSGKSVPRSSWSVFASQPAAEVFAPILYVQQRMLLATIFITLLAGGLTWTMLRRQLSPMLAAVKTLATLSATEQTLQPLVITRPDEVGALIDGFNRLMETLARREVAVRESEAKLKATLDAIPDLLFEMGLDGRYHDYHSPYTDLLAAPPDVLMGKLVSEVLPPDAAAITLSALLEAHQHGRSHGQQFMIELPQGQRWFELSIARKSTLPDEGTRFIVLSRDITERKHLEDALKKSEVRWKLENVAKIEFLTQMSHELRTPLDTILGNAQLLERPSGQALLAEGLVNIQKSGWHLLRMIDEILDYARGIAGKLTIAPELIDWPAFLRGVALNARVLASVNGNEFSLVTSGESLQGVMLDEGRVRQVLDNLLSNAARHTTRGWISLGCSTALAEDGSLCLDVTVTDSGEGVLLADQERIFLPFERGSRNTRAGGKGVGMGLAISRLLVEAMGGQLTVQSAPGEGASFRFWLPVQPVGVSERSSPAVKTGKIDSGYSGPQRTILVVDDVPDNRQVLTHLLQGIGFVVMEAAGGQAAAQVLASAAVIDLVLTDQFMANGDGWMVLQTVSSRSPGLPVVLMSAAPPDRPEVFARQLNFSAHLLKPLDHAGLLQCIGELLGLQWEPEKLRADLVVPLPQPLKVRANDGDFQALRKMIAAGQISNILFWADNVAASQASWAGFAREVSTAARLLDFPALNLLVERAGQDR